MGQKPDLNKLKEEIDNRKKGRFSPQQSNLGGAPRDTFLNGLIESLQTGRETASTNLVKTIENQTAIKSGEKPKLSINEIVEKPQQLNNDLTAIQNTPKTIDMGIDREEQMWRDIEYKKTAVGSTLADAMQEYINTPNRGKQGHPPSNINNKHISQQTPQQLNESILFENMKKFVDDHLVENYGEAIEQAIKSTIMEMYSTEKILQVLNDNKEMIKKMVYDIIRELQQKNKKKTD